MPKFIITTGTPGSGKSTILSKLDNINKISLADEMLRGAQNMANITGDRDKLHGLSDDEITAIRAEALKRIGGTSENAMIDTHASVKKGTRYVPGITTEGLGTLNKVGAILYIDATAQEIMARRKNDKTRVREDETVGEIEEQRIVNISLIAAFAFSLNVPVYIVHNQEGKAEEAVNEVKRIVKEILG